MHPNQRLYHGNNTRPNRLIHIHVRVRRKIFHLKEYSYNQALTLRIKRVCSTFDEYKKHSNDLVKRFVEKWYNENIIRNQIERVDNLEGSALLNKPNAIGKNVVPFSITYSPTLPNIKEVINKH